MILCDGEIRQHCEHPPEFSGQFEDGDPNFPIMVPSKKLPLVDPFLPQNLQPASIDVRLGNTFKVFERDHSTAVDMRDPVDITKEVVVPEGGHFTLHPGEFVLGHTIEKVNMPDNMVSRIEGKSSTGRLGLLVHVTAGFIDPGFRGNVTLEMACLHPLAVMLFPGQLIAQLSFQWMSAPAEKPYRGRYQDAKGVESSRYDWKGRNL